MIRSIDCISPNGEAYKINALKHDFISKFEILLPLRYQLVYSGCEWVESIRTNTDFNIDVIKNSKEFRHTITVINLDPKVIEAVEYDMNWQDSDKDIELFKYIVANCLRAIITLNGDNSLYNIEYSYDNNIHGTDLDFSESISLINEDYICEEYLLREEY